MLTTTTKQSSGFGLFLKFLAQVLKNFFTAGNNREFERLKDYIAS